MIRIRFVSWLGLLAIVLLPVFKMSFVPVSYSPPSLIPAALLGIVFFFGSRGRIERADVATICFVLYVVLVSFIFLGVKDIGVDRVLRGILPVLAGLAAFLGFRYYFRFVSIDQYLNILRSVLKIVLCYGIFEIVAIYLGIGGMFRDALALALSGNAGSRVQLFTSEASWASLYLVFAFPLLGRLSWIYRGMWLMLFAATFSLYGFATLVIGLIGYRLLMGRSFTRTLFQVLLIGAGTLLVAYAVKLIVSNLASSGDLPYYLTRIIKLDEASTVEASLLESLDGSVFVRIMYPVYAFLVSLSYPFGMGAAMYPFSFNDAMSWLPLNHVAYRNFEIMGDISSVSADPRNLYVGIYVMGGLLGLAYLIFMLNRVRRDFGLIKRFGSPAEKLVVLQLVLMGAACLQFGSFAFVLLWIPLAAVLTISRGIRMVRHG
ncbi:hypothetical protein R1H25_09655 [Stenotrophomonas sp. C2852]|uniref:hypothetical protein n=1 Tax=Stenotrophomonas sp. C2852 TaxID=3077845 RepID=UPI00293C423A|nr:hypothetical protein [Stenotrophomonas sp. C2852]MDV3435721.1 hypothetical protein [Stenotrophomonas sp. C2852]